MAELDVIARMEAIARELGGFRYPWTSALGVNDGEETYAQLVEAHLTPGATLLDAGCGHGPDMLRFAPQVRRYVGYDLSEGLIRIAAEACAGHKLANVELIHANSSATANGGWPHIPVPDGSVDMIVSRRGPTNFILDARRVCRPGAWLIQLNPQPVPAPAWDDLVPNDLRSEPHRDVDIGAHIRGLLDDAGIALHSQWTFDVPEYFTEAEQLYAYLAWNQFYGLGRRARPFAQSREALEAVIANHAGPDGLEVRRKRYLWAARIS